LGPGRGMRSESKSGDAIPPRCTWASFSNPLHVRDVKSIIGYEIWKCLSSEGAKQDSPGRSPGLRIASNPTQAPTGRHRRALCRPFGAFNHNCLAHFSQGVALGYPVSPRCGLKPSVLDCFENPSIAASCHWPGAPTYRSPLLQRDRPGHLPWHFSPPDAVD
jgi:hypothetical protein